MAVKIELYPSVPKPRWLKVGAEVGVHGEGVGKRFRVTALANNRALVVPEVWYKKGVVDGCWESFHKIYRPKSPTKSKYWKEVKAFVDGHDNGDHFAVVHDTASGRDNRYTVLVWRVGKKATIIGREVTLRHAKQIIKAHPNKST
jgi:hypothetical protein